MIMYAMSSCKDLTILVRVVFAPIGMERKAVLPTVLPTVLLLM